MCVRSGLTGKTSLVAYRVVRHHMYHNSSSQMVKEERVKTYEKQVFHTECRKTIRSLTVDIEEIPVKEFLRKVFNLVG